MQSDLESASVRALRLESDRLSPYFRGASLGQNLESHENWESENQPKFVISVNRNRPKSAFGGPKIEKNRENEAKNPLKAYFSPKFRRKRLIMSPRLSPQPRITVNQIFVNGMAVTQGGYHLRNRRHVQVQAEEGRERMESRVGSSGNIRFEALDMRGKGTVKRRGPVRLHIESVL